MTEQRYYISVYLKSAWGDEWVKRNDIEPVDCTLTIAPSLGAARFKIRYGSGIWENLSSLVDGTNAVSYGRQYIRITGADDSTGTNEAVWWSGVIPAEELRLLGATARGARADQIIQAYSLDYLLDSRLDKAWVRPVGGGLATQIDHLPVFNRKIRAGGVQGNRSTNKFEFNNGNYYTYVFAADAELWSNFQIIEYLLLHYQLPLGLGGPRFGFTCTSEVADALKQMVGMFDFNSVTLRQALNILINRKRGFFWTLYIDMDDNTYLMVQSLLDEDLTVGNIVLPAHRSNDRVTLDLWHDSRFADMKVVKDSSQVFDKIVVRGARIKTCCTFAVVEDSLEVGWTTDEETAYKDAAKNTTGYGSLTTTEQEVLNDKFRTADRFDRVFTTFVVPANWNWISSEDPEDPEIPKYPVSPKFSPYTGEFSVDGEGALIAGAHWNSDHRFLPLLPFKTGFDYSSASPVDKNPAGSEPELRKMFALGQDLDDAKHVYLDKKEPAAASVRPLTGQMGVAVKFRPQHYLAANNFSGAEPSRIDDVLAEDGCDYESLVVTAMIETDQYLQLYKILSQTETMRTIEIIIPEAELWYVVPETVVDVTDDGSFVYFGCTDPLLRDDRDMLRTVLAAATAWYGKQRHKLTITIQNLAAPVHIGQMIDDVAITEEGSGSVVSSITFNFQQGTTVIHTDFQELNLRSIFSMGLRSSGGSEIPNLAVAGRKIQKIFGELETLKAEIDNRPLRTPVPASASAANVIRFAYIEEDAPDADNLKGSLLHLTTGKLAIQATLDAAAADDKGSGKVGLPSTAHGFVGGERVVIVGTDNYDETWTLDDDTSTDELVIVATHTAETFSVTDTVTTAGGEYNIDIYGEIINASHFDLAMPRLPEGCVAAVVLRPYYSEGTTELRWYIIPGTIFYGSDDHYEPEI